MEETYFSDESIIEQGSAMIERKDGTRTGGISIVVMGPNWNEAVEVLLEYDELKDALAELDADREAMPYLYVPNAKAVGLDAAGGQSHTSDGLCGAIDRRKK